MHIARLNLRATIPAAFESAVVSAIGEAEKGNRGEVRVHIEKQCPIDDVAARSLEVFEELGMAATRGATGVLLYVALDDARSAVCVGTGIPCAGDPEIWLPATERIARGAKSGDVAGGVVRALGHIGMLLRMHVPGEDVHGNELPNTITSS